MLQIRKAAFQELRKFTSWRDSFLQVRLLPDLTFGTPCWSRLDSNPSPAETVHQRAGGRRQCPDYRAEGGDAHTLPAPEEQDMITPHTEAGPVRVLDVIHQSP